MGQEVNHIRYAATSQCASLNPQALCSASYSYEVREIADHPRQGVSKTWKLQFGSVFRTVAHIEPNTDDDKKTSIGGPKRIHTMSANTSPQADDSSGNKPRSRQRTYKPAPVLEVPDIEENASERKRILNVLAQRRYSQYYPLSGSRCIFTVIFLS